MKTSITGEINNILLPPGKAPEQPVFNIEFNFNEDYHLDINVHQVSNYARLAVTADGTEIFSHYFIASDRNSGDWAQIDWSEQQNIYQSISNRDYRALIPAGTSRVAVEITAGDWLSVNSLCFSAVNRHHLYVVTPSIHLWGRPISSAPIRLEYDGDVVGEMLPQASIPESIAEPDPIAESTPAEPDPIVESTPAEPDPMSKPAPEPKPAPARESGVNISPALVPAPKRNHWIIGAAASVIAVASIALLKKRRR